MRGRVQRQLREKKGGANDSILYAVVRENLSGRGKDYYNPSKSDIIAYNKALEESEKIKQQI